FRKRFLEFTQVGVFDVLVAAATVPLDVALIKPIAHGFTALAVSATAAQTGGLGPALAGAAIGVAVNVVATTLIGLYANTFYPEFLRDTWPKIAAPFEALGKRAAETFCKSYCK